MLWCIILEPPPCGNHNATPMYTYYNKDNVKKIIIRHVSRCLFYYFHKLLTENINLLLLNMFGLMLQLTNF